MLRRYLRGWRLVAALSAIAVLALSIALYWNERRALDPLTMLSYLPERESTLFYADVRAIRNSGLLEKLAGSAIAEEPEYKAFVTQTGFDYKRDLDRIAASTAGGIAYFLLEGRFDWPRLRDHVKQQGGTCKDDNCFVAGSTPERVISFRQVRRNLMALASGPSETAARAIERRPVRNLGFETPAQPVWLSLPASTIRSQEKVPQGTRLFLKALESADRVLLTLGPHGSDFELAMDVLCPREEDAVVLKHQLEGLTKLVASLISRERQKPNPSDLSGVLTSGGFERSGQHVKGRWTLSRAFVDSLASGG